MEYGFRIYVVSGEETVEEDFTTEDIMSVAIEIMKAETLPEILNFLINNLNNSTSSNKNYYFLYDEYGMSLLSDIPNNFVEK